MFTFLVECRPFKGNCCPQEVGVTITSQLLNSSLLKKHSNLFVFLYLTTMYILTHSIYLPIC
jgi:hypothetical protein